MCGIWIFFGDKHPDDRLVDIRHRGPDGHAVSRLRSPAGDVELAHWRLSIFDLSDHGAQPMVCLNGRYHLVFNGEIYNFRELRAELEKAGYTFISDCDTEIIPAAYDYWGESCLHHFLGMFAFGLWDVQNQTLFLARDRFGIKPLYYHVTPRGVAFASEIKQFTGLHGFQPRANPPRITDFLIYAAQDHTSETLWSGVFQLRGGECTTLSAGSFRPGEPLKIRRWYELRPPARFEGSFEDATRRYRAIFDDVIRLHLRSDVPVGSCLSGGMDSSAIVCTVSDLLKKNQASPAQRTFSCCYDTPECDERRFMEAVEKHTGADAHYLLPKRDDVFRNLSDRVWHQDEPLHNASIISQHQVFEAAKNAGVKVMLDGQGGDEQLASYPQFFGLHLFYLLLQHGLRATKHEANALKRTHGWSMKQSLQNLAFIYAPAFFWEMIRLQKQIKDEPRWLNKKWLKNHAIKLVPPRKSSSHTSFTTEWLSRINLTSSPLPMLLHWEDRNSMAHSIEARVPFMDHRLIEFTLSLPDEFKTQDGITKRILKGAMRGTVPNEVTGRTDKKGFTTPEERWFREDSDGAFRKRMLESAERVPALFNRAGLEKEINEVHANQRPYSHLYWRILTFGPWVDRFGISM